MLDHKDHASRFQTLREHDLATNAYGRATTTPLSSGVVGTFISRRADTGLLTVDLGCGGIGLVTSITSRAFTKGDRIPAVTSGSISSYGFADARF
jgi:hypothetical protein